VARQFGETVALDWTERHDRRRRRPSRRADPRSARRHALRYVLLRMRNRSRCRGGTCIELAITIGAIGALIIVLTSMVARKLERTVVVAADSGAMCR
jgi:hypothetical protein